LGIERFFAILKDDAWHSIAELSEQTETEANKLVEYAQFLAGKGVVIYEDKTQRIKIEPEWNHIIPQETEMLEPKSTIATFIIPGETSVEFQHTLISNLTKIEIELTIRSNKRIQEIAIDL
jgi:hypothetical protein